MASTVNIGTLQGVLAMRDEFSAQLQKFETRIKTVEDKVKGFSRTNKSETDKLREAYNKVAASLDPVVARTQKYEKQVETLNRALKAGIITQAQYNAQLVKAQSHLQTTTHWTQRLGASIGSELTGQFTRFFAVSALITAGIGAIVSVTGQLIKANIEAEGTSRRVEEAIRRYGERSGVSAKQVDDISNSISRLTGLDDELIADAEVIGLKFNRIGSDIFPRFAKVATDLGVSIGDVSAGFEKAGKLVNQPLRALTLFAREGYAVGKSQAELVKSLVTAGEIEKAQVEILEILESQYAGTAEAARDTMGGALGALGVAWENLLEKMGEDSTGPIREGIEKLITLIEDLTDRIDDLTLGWHHASIAVNSFLIGLTKAQIGAAEGPIARLLNPAGAASSAAKQREGLKGLEEDLSRSQKALTDIYFKMAGLGKVSEDSHRRGSRAALEQTEAESKLNDEYIKQLEAITAIREKQSESIQVLSEKLALALKGPGLDLVTRLKEEQRINDAHEYRLNLLEKQAKFGKIIGKELADTDKRIKDLSREIELKLKISLKIDKMDLAPVIKGLFDNVSGPHGMDELIKTLDVMEENEIAFREYAEAQQEWLRDYAEQWKESFKTIADLAREDMAAVEAAVNDGFLTIEEGERALAEIRRGYIEQSINDWVSFANTLGNLFGGLFAKIASALNNIQAAFNAGNQLGGMLQKYAGAGSWAGDLGMYAAAFTAFYEMTKAIDAHELRQRGRRFTSGGSAQTSMEGGLLTFGGGGVHGEDFAKQLETAFNSILEAIGGFVSSLPEIEIQIRNDGKRFRAVVAGIYLGTFKSAEEALGVAIQQALSQASFLGVGPEILRVLELAGQTLNMTFEELLHNLDIAKQAERIRLGDAGSAYVDMINDFLRLIDAQKRLGLSIDETISAMNRSIQAEKNRALGIDTSTSDQLAALKSLNDGMAQASSAAQAAVQREIDNTLARIATLEAAMASGVVSGGGSGSGGSGGTEGGRPEGYTKDIQSQWEQELADLRRVLAQYTEELGKIPEALSSQELDMGIIGALLKYLEKDKEYRDEAVKLAKWRVEIEFELIKAKLVELGKWEQFQTMYLDAYNAAMGAAERQARGGGGSGQRASARDFVSDKRFELSLFGMDDLHARLAELNKDYAERLKEAGKDNKLRAEILALQKEETALIVKEHQKGVVSRFNEMVGRTNAFTELEDRFSSMGDEIRNAGFGAQRTARMLAELSRAEAGAIQTLGNQLHSNLLGGLANYIDNAVIKNNLLAAAAQIKFNLEMENYRIDFELLKKKGLLTQAEVNKIEDAFRYIENNMPDFTVTEGGDIPGQGEGYWTYGSSGLVWHPGTPPGSSGSGDSSGSSTDPTKEAQDLLSRYIEDGMNPLSRRLKEINDDFIKITQALGSTSDILQVKSDAIESAYEDAFSGIKDFYDDLLSGPMSHLSTQEQYASATSKYNSLIGRLISGDFSAIEDLEGLLPNLEDLAEKMFGTSTTGFTDFRSGLLADLEGIFSGLGLDFDPLNISNLSSALEKAGLISAQQSPETAAINKTSGDIVKAIEGSSSRQEKLLQKVADEALALRLYLAGGGVVQIHDVESSSGWRYS